ncbi:MAG TPA: hypothetical protein VMV89_13465 [Candidatus Paceibacterota bacterium]|nr:hypothetical protein [Candidatus Paceibacterota bacterium]
MVEAVGSRCAGHYFTGQAPALASPAQTVGQLGELFQIVAAINDAGVEQRGRFQPWSGSWFRSSFFRHAQSVRGKFTSVNPRLEKRKAGIFQSRPFCFFSD